MRRDDTEVDIPLTSAVDEELELFRLLDDDLEDSTEVETLHDCPTSVSLSCELIDFDEPTLTGSLRRPKRGWSERATRSTHRAASR